MENVMDEGCEIDLEGNHLRQIAKTNYNTTIQGQMCNKGHKAV